MNCLEFRREKLQDPRRLSGEALAHQGECPQCLAFARSIDETDDRIGAALAVRVPEGLSERILLRHRDFGRPRLAVWALAASVVLAVLAVVAFGRFSGAPSDHYARLAIEHVMMEPKSLTTVRESDSGMLRSVVDGFGGTVTEPIGRIRYIELCPVGDGKGWHIVFETPEGLATLILVPEKRIRAVAIANASGWNALVRPAPRGYYAIITESPDMTAAVDRLIRKRIIWNA